jgi:hypothetical protein
MVAMPSPIIVPVVLAGGAKLSPLRFRCFVLMQVKFVISNVHKESLFALLDAIKRHALNVSKIPIKQ